MKTINVASNVSTLGLAELLKNSIENSEVELKSIGAGAVNKAVKAIAVAKQQYDLALSCSPSFFNTEIDGQEKSGISLYVKIEEVKEDGKV